MRTELTISTPPNSSLLPVAKTDSNRELIKEYLMAGGEGVDLTDKQQELLKRWEKADELIRENVGRISRADIAKILSNRFDVSLCTAKTDMVNAEYVFSSSNPINKSHRIGLRIEFLEKQILKAANAADFKAVAALEKVLALHLKNYPDITPVEVPKNLIFSFDIEKLMSRVVDPSAAETLIDKQLEKNKLMEALSTDIEEEEGFENE